MEESMNIATAKDLDILLAQLKGDQTDELLQAIENDGEEEKEKVVQIDTTNGESELQPI